MGKWVKCDLRMPPVGTPVIIWDGTIQCVAEWVMLPFQFPHDSSNIYWKCVGAGGYECDNDFDTPTHWMQLDKPPEE